MRIVLVGPGIMTIPPKGWGAVEILIWDTCTALKQLGHEVQIVNTRKPEEIISQINQFRPDFVHVHYDEFVGVYQYIQYPKAITSHFGYLERPELYGSYVKIAQAFAQVQPNVFCLSKGIKVIYSSLMKIPEGQLFVTPNGVDLEAFRYTMAPEFPNRSIYLAKIDYRKRQHIFQSIDSLWYAGNNADNRFDTEKNYLGEWSKNVLHDHLTEYGNLVLLSDGEAHPLVCMEALAAGLGVVVSEWGSANLDTSKEFITVIPESKVNDIEFVENSIIENRDYSISHREEIREYAKKFDWMNIIQNYYIPSVKEIVGK